MNARRLAAENLGASRRACFDGRDLLHWAATLDKLSTIILDNLDVWTGIIIENASGAHGNIGPAQIGGATPDGCAIELGLSSSHALNAGFYLLPYDGHTNAIAKTRHVAPRPNRRVPALRVNQISSAAFFPPRLLQLAMHPLAREALVICSAMCQPIFSVRYAIDCVLFHRKCWPQNSRTPPITKPLKPSDRIRRAQNDWSNQNERNRSFS
jgi:hypothetical protein